MGTYLVYCNHTRKEFVRLSGLRDGGDKINAVYYCAEALIYLLDPVSSYDDEYRGRWSEGHGAHRQRQAIQILPDSETSSFDLEEFMGYADISEALRADMLESQSDLIDLSRFRRG